MLSDRPLLCCRKNLRRVSGRAFCNFSRVGQGIRRSSKLESPRQRTSPVLVGSTSLNRRSGDCHTGLSLARTSVVLPPETEEYGSALNPDAVGAAFLDGALTGRPTESHRKDHSWRPKDESLCDS